MHTPFVSSLIDNMWWLIDSWDQVLISTLHHSDPYPYYSSTNQLRYMFDLSFRDVSQIWNFPSCLEVVHLVED